jgi:hypothetical protein
LCGFGYFNFFKTFFNTIRTMVSSGGMAGAMWGMMRLAVVVLVLAGGIWLEGASGTELMLEIGPGREECFYEDLVVNKTLYVDYSVVGTTQGATDIDFQISDTHGRPMITEFRRTESRHE